MLKFERRRRTPAQQTTIPKIDRPKTVLPSTTTSYSPALGPAPITSPGSIAASRWCSSWQTQTVRCRLPTYPRTVVGQQPVRVFVEPQGCVDERATEHDAAPSACRTQPVTCARFHTISKHRHSIGIRSWCEAHSLEFSARIFRCRTHQCTDSRRCRIGSRGTTHSC